MNKVINTEYKAIEKTLDHFILNYDSEGSSFGNQQRNSLRLFPIENETLNIKSFKVPNLINKIAYNFFRKSKAQRSFEYANILKEKAIGTPDPVGFYEYKSALFFGKSYYISKHLSYDMTYRELTKSFDIPNYEAILRAFTRFTFKLHENRINFLDHSPGNTLIKIEGTKYEFFLVDLNRMIFEDLSFEKRIKNFAKLSIHKYMVEIMSDEYAKCIGKDYKEVFELMWKNTQDFQESYHRRRRLKETVKFWKKK